MNLGTETASFLGLISSRPLLCSHSWKLIHFVKIFIEHCKTTMTKLWNPAPGDTISGCGLWALDWHICDHVRPLERTKSLTLTISSWPYWPYHLDIEQTLSRTGNVLNTQFWLREVLHLQQLHCWRSNHQDSRYVAGTVRAGYSVRRCWKLGKSPVHATVPPTHLKVFSAWSTLCSMGLCPMQGVSTICFLSPLPCWLCMGGQHAGTATLGVHHVLTRGTGGCRNVH